MRCFGSITASLHGLTAKVMWKVPGLQVGRVALLLTSTEPRHSALSSRFQLETSWYWMSYHVWIGSVVLQLYTRSHKDHVTIEVAETY